MTRDWVPRREPRSSWRGVLALIAIAVFWALLIWYGIGVSV